MITPQQIADFERDGVVVLRGVFDDWLDGLRKALDENMQTPSWRERTYRPDDGPAFFQDYVVWDKFSGYRDFVRMGPMGDIAAALMRSPTARIFHDHVLVKEPGNSNKTPWHQDAPYYLCRGAQSVSFWVPLDPIARERTIEYVAGSHLWDTTFRPDRFDGTPLFDGDTATAVPDIDGQKDQFEILGWAVKPGDAVAFNFRTLHGAPGNRSPLRRRVISYRWVGADAVFAQRLGPTSPAFPGLTYQDGAPFDAPEFPILGRS